MAKPQGPTRMPWHDPDRVFILDGLRNGFNLIPESDPSCVDSYDNDNYVSATRLCPGHAKVLFPKRKSIMFINCACRESFV